MKLAYLFPGQGSQFVGMGKGLFERFPEHTRQASSLLGYRIDALCLSDPDKQLTLTRYTQPALYVVGAMSLLAQSADRDSRPFAMAGHSLGEYVALFGADVFDFETGLALVAERARLMGEVSGGGMAAVTQMSAARLADLLRSHAGFGDVDIANYNTPTQTVLSGDLAQLEALGALVRARGGRYSPLRVSAAFHSRSMRDAQERFGEYAASLTFRPPRLPVISNVTATPYPTEGDQLRALLVSQIASPVQWLKSIRWLLRSGVTDLIEVGPGQVLSGLTRAISTGELEAPERSLTTRPNHPPREQTGVMFLCPGQGGQYFRMGRALYERGEAFRTSFDACAAIAQTLIGESITDVVYCPTDPAAEFSRTLHTHVANFAFGYSLIAQRCAEGATPCCFVGWSLGEYVALAATGAMTLQQALELVVRQASDVEAYTKPSKMLVVLGNVNSYYAFDRVFEATELVGIHSSKSFVVTGSAPGLEQVMRELKIKGIQSLRLPVCHGFHSTSMDPIAERFKAMCAGLTLHTPSVPIYSSALRGRVEHVTPDYLWRVCRSRFNFQTALALAVQEHPGASPADVGPSALAGVQATVAAAIGRDSPSATHGIRDAMPIPRQANLS